MKKYYLMIVLSLFILLCHAQWQPDFRLTPDPGYSYISYNNAHCIANSGSMIHVVWWDIRDGNREIYYKRSLDHGVTWQEDTRLTFNSGWSEYPAIAVSGSMVHVVWMDDRDESFYPELYYKRSIDGGVTWEEDKRLTFNPSDPGIPCIAATGNDVHIVWHDIRDKNWEIYYKRSTDSGVTWENDTRLTNSIGTSERASVAVSGVPPDEQVYVVWNDDRDNDKEIYFKRSVDGGSTWLADTRLTKSIDESQAACVAVRKSTVHVIWSDHRDGNDEIYYKVSFDEGYSWQNDTRLTNAAAVSTNPSIAVWNSLIHVVWVDLRNGNEEIYYKRSADNGVSWEPDTRLTNNTADSENPSIALTDSVVHVVWQDLRNVNEDIYYKRNPTGNLISGIENPSNNSPDQLELFQNHPNPFKESTCITWQQPMEARIVLKVYDYLGRVVKELLDSDQPAGVHSITFNTSGIPAGIYYYQLKVIGSSNNTKLNTIQIRKLLIIK